MSERRKDVMGRRVFRKVLGKCLSRLETSRATPPLFLQFYFLKRLISSEISSESRIMLRKAFCGNGFIHLNIPEFYEEDIGGQKTCTYFGDQGSKWAISIIVPDYCVIFLKNVASLSYRLSFFSSGGVGLGSVGPVSRR